MALNGIKEDMRRGGEKVEERFMEIVGRLGIRIGILYCHIKIMH